MTEDRKKRRKLDPVKAAKYKWLRLPEATPEEAAARREYLIKVGVIIPEPEVTDESR